MYKKITIIGLLIIANSLSGMGLESSYRNNLKNVSAAEQKFQKLRWTLCSAATSGLIGVGIEFYNKYVDPTPNTTLQNTQFGCFGASVFGMLYATKQLLDDCDNIKIE